LKSRWTARANRPACRPLPPERVRAASDDLAADAARSADRPCADSGSARRRGPPRARALMPDSRCAPRRPRCR
jgi:hypothetical protein